MSSLTENIDKIVGEKIESSGSGAGALIAAIRILNRGAVRWALRLLTKEVEFNGEKETIDGVGIGKSTLVRSNAQRLPTSWRHSLRWA
jgi:hypothetical protein